MRCVFYNFGKSNILVLMQFNLNKTNRPISRNSQVGWGGVGEGDVTIPTATSYTFDKILSGAPDSCFGK